MTRFRHDLILRMIKLLDAVLVTIPFAMCWYLYYAKRVASPYYAKGDYLVVALFFVLFIIFGRVYDAFLMSMQRISEIIYEQFLAAAISDFIMYIVIWLLSKHLPNILPGVAALVGQVIMASIWAYNAHHAYFKTFPPQATAVIYDTRRGMERLIGKYGLDAKYKVVSTATAGECIENLSMLDGISTVFLSGIHSHDRNIILKYCVENNITVFVVPRIGDTIMSGAHHMHMFHLPMLRVGRYNPQPEYLFVKRLLDIVISAIALVILSPIFLVTAIAIKATDHGPVFYKQIRLTKDGKEFGILKFRSMRVDAEKDGVARLSSGENDDRITPVGKHTGRNRGAQVRHGAGHRRLHTGEGRVGRGLHAVPTRRNRGLHCVHSRRCRAADCVPAGTEYRLDIRPTAAGQAAEVVPPRRDGTLDRID